MERKEEAMAAIDALNGTMYKGRQLAVELSKAQPLINQIATAGNSGGLAAGGDERSIYLSVLQVECLRQLVQILITLSAFFSSQVVFFQDHPHH